MEALLTRGAVAAIAAGKMWEVEPAARRAVLEVVDVSWVVKPRVVFEGRALKQDDYAMVLSDGVHTLGQFRLSTPLQHYIRDGHIRKGTVLRLLNVCCNYLSIDKRIYIFHFEVVRTECMLIGSPTPYKPGLKPEESDASDEAPIGRSHSKFQLPRRL